MLFLSSQIFQHRNLGVHIHASLRRFFLLKLKGARCIQQLISSVIEFGILTEIEPNVSLQASLVYSQVMNRCPAFSSARLHRRHHEGPS